MPILKTRLYKPKIDANCIKRESLHANLETEKNKPLTLIVAGPCFGKSLLLGQWLEAPGTKCSWISFDEDCNQLSLFINYMVEAINQHFTGSRKVSHDIIKATDFWFYQFALQQLPNYHQRRIV